MTFNKKEYIKKRNARLLRAQFELAFVKKEAQEAIVRAADSETAGYLLADIERADKIMFEDIKNWPQ